MFIRKEFTLRNNIGGKVSGTSIQAETIHNVSIQRIKENKTNNQPPGKPISALKADPRMLGVHSARRGIDGSPLPPYVERDKDVELQALLSLSADQGGAILIEGDSTSGKTRSALHAVRKKLPESLIFIPTPGQDINNIIPHISTEKNQGPSIIWMDDLHRFLGLGERGLNEQVMDDLQNCRALLVATLRSEFSDIYRSPQGGISSIDGGHWKAAHGERESISLLLRRFARVELERNWSLEEVNRARETGDDRLEEAANYHNTHGIAEYIAAGPELLRKWTQARRSTHRGGHPRGHAIVASAVDLARTGLLSAVTRQVLEQTHQHYLEGVAVLRPESFSEALEWAQQPGLGASGLLLPASDNNQNWRAFDYLIEATSSPIPKAVWRIAANQTENHDELMAIAINAHYSGQNEIVMEICGPLAHKGVPRAMNRVGYWAQSKGLIDEAEEWYKKAAAAGNTNSLVNLGSIMAERGDYALAEDFYQQAVTAGNSTAFFHLGLMFDKKGNKKEAEAFYRRAIENGSTKASGLLGTILHTQHRWKEAEKFYRKGVASGDRYAIYNLGILRENQGHYREAVQLLREALTHFNEDDESSPLTSAREIIDRWKDATSD
ncbi:tetratricopeptide repeat protein [Nocardiopsis sp. NPDC055551]